MDVYPEDLGPAHSVRLQQARGMMNGMPLGGGSYYTSLGAMWGMAPGIFLNLWLHLIPNGPGDFFLAGGVGAALGYACGFFIDRSNRSKQRRKEVTVLEIKFVRNAETDPLGLEYLSLVSELISARSPQDPSVEQSIRNAIRDIGFGVERLPGQPADDLLIDAGAFTEKASRLAAEAAQESDPVVAASLQRQSAALSQRGEAVSRNSALARRSQVLRHEMTEQIKALKTMAGAMALGDSSGSYEMAALARNVQQVATEARSLAEAKQELDSALKESQSSRKDVASEQSPLQELSGR